MGFGYVRGEDGSHIRFPQQGRLVIEDGVEIGANTTIDRGALGETRIGRGTKIDDLVLVGHASKLGANNMICGQTGLAGSTEIGDNCIFAGQSASSGHLTVGDNVIVTAQSGLPRDVESNQIRSGSPAVDNKLWLRYTAALTRLPDLQKRVRDLESQLAKLKS
jgi:UDP-3-O-[3-hydroxymyristoyl] glucosamine N-acyltransferase